jgi:hypothetical protein
MIKAMRFVSEIPQGLYHEDWDKWRGIQYTSTNNITQITNFIRDRLAYMDEAIKQL